MNKKKKIIFILSLLIGLTMVGITTHTYYRTTVYAAEDPATTAAKKARIEAGNASSNLAGKTGDDGFSVTVKNGEGGLSGNLKMLLVLTVLSLAPSILIMMTSFTRIIIVLHFVRTALGVQTVPPNQVLIGLALFLTLFIMHPTFNQINENAIKPLDEGKITQEEALDEALNPLKTFMCGQTKVSDLNTFCDIANTTYETDKDTGAIIESSIPLDVLVPSFIISELRSAFIMGFIIYIPFIVIDMVVSSVLMSMGMMMLPPTTISMPFKILLFILADGWNLVIVNLVKTFY
ncbi:MAG: flagellar type III secretion system pore protein FliP [Lachnospiraceae bacterium]